MNNKLETFVKENRRSFDVKEPSANLWAKIEMELDAKARQEKKPFRLYLWMSAAAAIVVVIGLTWLLAGQNTQKEVDFAEVNAGYVNKENHYAGLIEEKRDSLAIFAAANPELYKRFTADLKKLDEEYSRLKEELPASANQTSIINAMIENREIQLRLLKQQLMIINQVDDSKRVNQI